jgi:hypothetical protein
MLKLSFKEYIQESYPFTEKETASYKKGQIKEIEHTAILPSGHELVIIHNLTENKGKKYLETNFGFRDKEGEIEMDERKVSPPVPPEHAKAVMTTVSNSVDHMIKHHGVTNIEFYGNTERKDNLYGQYSRRLIRKHPGATHTKDGYTHIITIPRQ